MMFLIAIFFFFNTISMQSNITLSDLQWKNRVLLVFPTDDDSRNIKFELTEELGKELEDRDLIYFYMSDEIISNSELSFSADYQKKLKQQFKKGSKRPIYVLIGKDGSAKLRKENDTIDWQGLFATIDAMPMRMREMRNKPN
jgi:hypothetical protein